MSRTFPRYNSNFQNIRELISYISFAMNCVHLTHIYRMILPISLENYNLLLNLIEYKFIETFVWELHKLYIHRNFWSMLKNSIKNQIFVFRLIIKSDYLTNPIAVRFKDCDFEKAVNIVVSIVLFEREVIQLYLAVSQLINQTRISRKNRKNHTKSL